MDPWWRGGLLYQAYVRSFADSNGDGVGDLAGLRSRLDHLEWLGVDGLWLSPVNPSPDADWGYDVADYRDVQPAFGSLDELDRLIAEAEARRIRIVLDLVPNHTSDRHAWFADARSSREARHRDWYVWADSRRDGSPPNNWLSVFGGPAWTLDEPTGQWYLHNFLPEQPDLNWWNEEVREAFDEVLRFWFDRGIAGFRIDVAHGIVKDRELRDNPPADETDHENLRLLGQRHVYNLNRPEVHEVLKRWRRIADEYDPPPLLLGETWVMDLDRFAAFYGTGSDELHMAFNFPFVYAPFSAAGLREVVEATQARVPPDGWPVWTLSNHDVVRFPTRWGGDREDDARVRCALLILLGLRGTPVLYYGDEIGMEQVAVPHARLLDPVGLKGIRRYGRDGARTPMQWSAEPGAGFTDAGVEPWLPLGDHERLNVRAQRQDAGSVLSLVRDLIALRRGEGDLRAGSYASVPAPDGIWAWRRGARTLVAVNLSDADAELENVSGRIWIGTRRERDGDPVRGRLRLGPWEGVVATCR